MKKITISELGPNVISSTVGGAVVGSCFFDKTGSYVGAVLGAIFGIVTSFEPKEKQPRKDTSSKAS